ncbi:MAG: pyridoxamine 5'-phosphate oxidase family protein [Ktedonobacterales bacterium]|nr:pyridoxamine 5'-phosphate oxidase family protein [Ktedonobacterales bacterium]
MATHDSYHEGSRRLQDQFDSRRIADRLEQVTMHDAFTEDDRDVITRCAMFFLATSDADGCPDCSYKGGVPGFAQVINARTLVFPDYDGNGMFRSLGNILVNPHVGMLFIDFEQPNRLRVNGTATLASDDPLLEAYPGAQLIVRVTPMRIFPNCPRYIHPMRLVSHSVYAPRRGHTPPEPDWKRMEAFRDALPRRSVGADEHSSG